MSPGASLRPRRSATRAGRASAASPPPLLFSSPGSGLVYTDIWRLYQDTSLLGQMNMPSETIKLFLVHGDPKRLRTAELSNWTGKAVSGPRTEFEGVLSREESDKSGIYLLTGTDPETGKPAIYVGEAECIRDRIKNHNDEDFWNQVTFFVSKDENLTKAHIRYLGSQLFALAMRAHRAVVAHSQGSGSKLSKSDRSEMYVFLERVQQLLPVLGIDLLVPMWGATTYDAPTSARLYCVFKGGLKATGHRTANGFLVHSGSEAVATRWRSSEKWPWIRNLRQKLMDDGVLTLSGDRLLFTKDIEFATPSAAAAVIHAGHANGLTAWKDDESGGGKTLKELEVDAVAVGWSALLDAERER